MSLYTKRYRCNVSLINHQLVFTHFEEQVNTSDPLSLEGPWSPTLSLGLTLQRRFLEDLESKLISNLGALRAKTLENPNLLENFQVLMGDESFLDSRREVFSIEKGETNIFGLPVQILKNFNYSKLEKVGFSSYLRKYLLLLPRSFSWSNMKVVFDVEHHPYEGPKIGFFHLDLGVPVENRFKINYFDFCNHFSENENPGSTIDSLL